MVIGVAQSRRANKIFIACLHRSSNMLVILHCLNRRLSIWIQLFNIIATLAMSLMVSHVQNVSPSMDKRAGKIWASHLIDVNLMSKLLSNRYGPDIQCVPKSCGPPDEPPHGWHAGECNTFGCRITYHCHEGYELVGKRSADCQQDGSWSPKELPVCVCK